MSRGASSLAIVALTVAFGAAAFAPSATGDPDSRHDQLVRGRRPHGSGRGIDVQDTEVQIFPEALRGVGEGSHPWDTVPNGSMTNATVETITPQTVDKVNGQTLVVKYKNTEKKVFVPANAPVITYVPGDKSALTPGAHVILNATTAADGTLTATGVQVGKDGLVPPM